MPKVTIGRLMAGIALFALALATLRYPTQLGAAFMATIAVGALAASIGKAGATRGETRAGAIGFAAACGLYLAAYAVGRTEQQGWGGSPLVTTPLLDLLFPLVAIEDSFSVTFIFGGRARADQVFEAWANLDASPGGVMEASASFRMAGHSLFAILAGCLGSWAARGRFRRCERESTAG
jgi:hypothetical protein